MCLIALKVLGALVLQHSETLTPVGVGGTSLEDGRYVAWAF